MTLTRGIFIVCVLVVLDQLSKFWVVMNLAYEARVDFVPFLSLYFVYNPGVAFSWLAFLGPYALIMLISTIIIFVLWICKNTDQERWISLTGYVFVLGGAFGNLIDRVRIEKVIDMFLFHIDSIGFNFAIFNLADVFITIGAMAIILDEFLQWKYSTGENTNKEIKDD